MKRKLMRTGLVGALAAVVLVGALLPGLDAMGRVLLMPPLYYPAARILTAAFWVVGVGAAWVYRPPTPGADRE